MARMGWTRPSQPFQSPTTRTARAVGAHTANAVPSVPWWVRGWAPSTSHRRSWRPSPMRWRSRSPSVGQNGQGSTTVCSPPPSQPKVTA